MSIWGGGYASATAGLFGDIMSARGQEDTNAMMMANWQNERNWETQMSNTAMQRRVSDLKAAGLNPMLAVGGNGASTPGVAPPNLGNPNAAYANLGQQVASAAQTANLQAQRDNLNAQSRAAETQAGKNWAETTGVIPATIAKLKADTNVSENQALQVQANIRAINANIRNTNEQTTGVMVDNMLKGQNLEVIRATKDALIQIQQNNAKLGEYGLPEAKVNADYWNSNAAKYINYVNRALEPVTSAAGAALGGTGAVKIIKGLKTPITNAPSFDQRLSQ